MHLLILLLIFGITSEYLNAAASSSSDTAVSSGKPIKKHDVPDRLQTFLSNNYAQHVHPMHQFRLDKAPDSDSLLAVWHKDPFPTESFITPLQKIYKPAQPLKISNILNYIIKLDTKKKFPMRNVIRYTARVAVALAERIHFNNDHSYTSYQSAYLHNLKHTNDNSKKYYTMVQETKTLWTMTHEKTQQRILMQSQKLRTLANLFLVCRYPTAKNYPILEAFFLDLGCLPSIVDVRTQIQKFLTYAAEMLPLLADVQLDKEHVGLLYITALKNQLVHTETLQRSFIDPTLATALNLLIYHGHIELAPKLIFDRYKLYTGIVA